MKEVYGKDNVLNTITFKTEQSKSALLTSCRGLHIDNDTAQYLSGFVPIERGQAWSLSDCFFGNKDKDRKPIKEFVNEVEKYDRLKETALGLEGLITGRSIHASAVYVFDNGYLPQNSMMRSPTGDVLTTSLEMHDSDYCGGLKIDVLTIQGLDKIHKAMDLLQDQGVIEDKGSIKATYDYYLHPDVLEYNDQYMWKLLSENKIRDAFQMDTGQGKIACKMVKPTSLEQLAVANSVMRLMSSGTEQPIDTYVRYKNDISLWYDECRNHGLTEEEIKILEPYLLPVSGVAVTQEDIMRLVMEEKISNFTVKEANGLRKAVAKKKADLIESTRELFFKKGREIETSENLLSYIWFIQIGRQLGYSFSLNHTSPYSCICLQEMNIATRFNPIFWDTACLTINSGADESEENTSSKSKTTNYGKIAKAIGNIQSEGQAVALPDINRARFGFYPDVENEEIVFSLKGISGVSDDVASVILELRPFTSLKDFVTRMEEAKVEQGFKFSSSSVIALIKAGAFDKIENKDRMDIMIDYVKSISKPLGSLSFFSHMQTLKDLDLLTEEQIGREFRYFKYRNYVMRDKFFVRQDGKSPTTKVYYLDREKAEPYFLDNFAMDLKEGKDYWYNDQGFIEIKKGTFERIITKAVAPFVASVLNNPETLAKVNEERFYVKWEELGLGNNISKWEMDSLCFYYHDHELAHVKAENYLISEYKSLPETPVVAEFYKFRGKERPRFALTKICGTVLDKDKNKNTITLLTHDKEVVTIKFYKGQFGFYDKQISEIDSEGNKTVMEKSWFGRGNKLLITGYRSEDRFIPKKYNDSIFKHTVQLINYIDEEGNLFLQTDRYGYESDEYC